MKRRKYPKIADAFKGLREEKGCTQDVLSKDIDILKPQISELENGKREPSIRELKAYNSYFKAPMEYLLGITDNRHYENVLLGEHLGLSDEAVKGIMRIFALTISQKFNPMMSPMSVFNSLLSFKDDRFIFLLCYVLDYLELEEPNNVQNFDVILSTGSLKECITEHSEEFLLFRLQKNFVDLVKEIKKVQKTSEDKKNG